MKTQFKNPINSFAPVFLMLIAMFVLGFGCNSSKPAPDPLAGWTFRTFDEFLPLLDRHHYNLDKAVTDDYRNFITINGLSTSAVTGFYEDGAGQRAVEFEGFPPGQNASWQYVLIYDKENKRVKVIKYNHVKYQS